MTDYIKPGRMTDPGEFTGLLDGLPTDVAGVARVVQGLLVHEFLGDLYGVELSDERKQTVHLRKVSDMLDGIVALDGRPLDVARSPDKRLVTNCRGFTVLAMTLLRRAGVPARARCGFGTYFGDGMRGDHWVVEFHDGERWRLFDAQLDDVLTRELKIGFDVTDITRDEFVIAGDGWRRCREGRDDPEKYGLINVGQGWWWIAGNMIRDAAALDGVEMLPWDCWGAMPDRDREPDDWEFFDRLAAGEIKTADDDRVRVPDKVWNALRERTEPLR
ncbi:transglutaminase domain-containing protein [Actinoplanes sp. NPDC089786]|uniref:transglutaminase domain-containing protein n=1 Tax=Actinoplanes sp. NPDC089786 TaxID=3155185 RepID=UPI00344702A3